MEALGQVSRTETACVGGNTLPGGGQSVVWQPEFLLGTSRSFNCFSSNHTPSLPLLSALPVQNNETPQVHSYVCQRLPGSYIPPDTSFLLRADLWKDHRKQKKSLTELWMFSGAGTSRENTSLILASVWRKVFSGEGGKSFQKIGTGRKEQLVSN